MGAISILNPQRECSFFLVGPERPQISVKNMPKNRKAASLSPFDDRTEGNLGLGSSENLVKDSPLELAGSLC